MKEALLIIPTLLLTSSYTVNDFNNVNKCEITIKQINNDLTNSDYLTFNYSVSPVNYELASKFIFAPDNSSQFDNDEWKIGKDKYSYFLNGNNSRAIIRTNVNNDRKLLIVKDSYAHIMSQFLCQNYSEVHFLDPRYTAFDYEQYAKENGITDVLFLYNVSNFVEDNNLRKIN